MANATSGRRETRGKLSADERRQRWPLPPPSSPGGGPPCPVTEAATPMRGATRIRSCGTVRPAIGKTGGRESVRRAPREPRGLGEFAESLNRRCPGGGDVGRCGGGSGFHLSSLPGGRGNAVELRECGRRRAEEGAQDRGEGGRPTQVVLVRRASRSSSASVLFHSLRYRDCTL